MATGALDGDDDEDLFLYNYGEDFPEAFSRGGAKRARGRLGERDCSKSRSLPRCRVSRSNFPPS